MAGGKRITRIKINGSAVKELLNGPEIAADLQGRAEAIAASAGEGFEVRRMDTDRVAFMVSAESTEARRAEAEDRALTRAIDAGR